MINYFISALLLGLLTFSGCSNSLASKSLLLENSNWDVIALKGQSVLVGARITMEFAHGKVAGVSGCNHYNASYQSNAPSIKFSEAAVTKMWCESPEGAMRQEDAFFKNLRQVAQYSYDSVQLTLKNKNGDNLLTLSKNKGSSI